MGRPALMVVALLLLSTTSAFAEPVTEFDPQASTWAATHIVVAEAGRVVESWHGDLRPGDKLPGEAARIASQTPPRRKGPGMFRQGPPPLSGRRTVLFLHHGPINMPGYDPAVKVWTGADGVGHDPARTAPSNTTLAWVEGEDVYGLVCGEGVTRADNVVAQRLSGVAGLRQLVEVGLTIRRLVATAEADPNQAHRADRLAALLPTAIAYTPCRTRQDLLQAVARCGRAGVPHLVGWADSPDCPWRGDAVYALSTVGDDAFDAISKLLDAEAVVWRRVADVTKPEPAERAEHPPSVGGPMWLYGLLSAAQGMTLSPANRERLRTHPALRELDAKLAAAPDGSDLALARGVLRDIRAGKIGPAAEPAAPGR